jgi:primosomal protein N'
MTPPIVVQVVVDKPLAQGFDYLWDEELLGPPPTIGVLVEVPFGRGSLIGIVIKVSAHSDYELDKLKSVSRVLQVSITSTLLGKPLSLPFHRCGKSRKTGKKFQKN